MSSTTELAGSPSSQPPPAPAPSGDATATPPRLDVLGTSLFQLKATTREMQRITEQLAGRAHRAD